MSKENHEIIEKKKTSSFHKKNNSLDVDLIKEANEIVDEAKILEEKVVVFIKDSKSIFDHIFTCCNGKKDVIEDTENNK